MEEKPKPTRRRWFRFSLRTMLVLVAVSGVLLLLIVYPARLQMRAVGLVQSLGGVVYYEGNKPFADIPDSRSWLRTWLPDDYILNVLAVYLTHAQCSDGDLELLGGLAALQVLDLSSTLVTTVGLQHIKKLTGLHNLYLNGTCLTDGEMEELSAALPDCVIVDVAAVSVK